MDECFRQAQAISETWHLGFPAPGVNQGCPSPLSPSEGDGSKPLVCLSQSPKEPASPLKGVVRPRPAVNSPASLQLSQTGRGHRFLPQNRRTKRSQSQPRRGEEEVSVPVVPCALGPWSTLGPGAVSDLPPGPTLPRSTREPSQADTCGASAFSEWKLGLFFPVCIIGTGLCPQETAWEPCILNCSSVLRHGFSGTFSLSDRLNLHVKGNSEENLYFKRQSWGDRKDRGGRS